MTARWLLYILAFSFSTSLYLLYDQYEAFLLFMIMLLTPVISLCLLFIGRHFLQIKLLGRQFISVHGAKLNLPLSLRDGFYLFLTNISIVVQDKEHALSFTDFNLNAEKQYCSFQAGCCGRRQITVKHAEFYDLLGLFHGSKKIAQTAAVYVMPVLYETSFLKQPEPVSSAGAEQLGIRPYRRGDSTKNIHWKASAAHDDLYVREFYAENEADCLLLFDLPAAADNAVCNAVYDVFYAIGVQLLNLYGGFIFCYYLPNESFMQIKITSAKGFDRQIIEYMDSGSSEGELINLCALSYLIKTDKNKIFYVSASSEKVIRATAGRQLSERITSFIIGDEAAAVQEHCVYIDKNDIEGSLAAGAQ